MEIEKEKIARVVFDKIVNLVKTTKVFEHDEELKKLAEVDEECLNNLYRKIVEKEQD